MKENNEFFWIIGGGQLQVPLIDEVKKLGYKIIITDKNPECICKDLADIFFPIDIFNIEDHLRIAKSLIKNGEKIVGVLAAGIDAPITMAVLAKHLEINGVDPEIAKIVHNKNRFRTTLKKLGHPTPKFFVINNKNLNQINSVIKEIGFPLIVKNSDSSGSRGTRIFDKKNTNEIKKQIELAIKVSRSGNALIEECWEGSEHTVETIFDVNGEFHPCFITDRIFDKKNGYPVEIELFHPSKLPIPIQKEMFEIAKKVATDLGITIGAAKYDMILTKKGIRIIEMTVRLSGGFDCQYLVPAATGKNVLKAAILTALGKPFSKELLDDKKSKYSISCSLWPKLGKIKKIEGIEHIEKISGYEQFFLRYSVGDVVEPYIDSTKRFCFIITSGNTEIEAREAANRIKTFIKVVNE